LIFPHQNLIRARLLAGEVPIGIQCFSGSSSLVEVMALAGFDFVMIDMEHTSLSLSEVHALVGVADAGGMSSLVRVPDHSGSTVRRVLESGAAGVVVPHVTSATEARAVLSAALYPPLGERGMCPSTRAAAYSTETWGDYARESNSSVLVVPLLEDPEAVANAESICAVEGIDVVFFGPGDLGMTMGVGAAGLASDIVRDALDEVLRAASNQETAVMTVPFPDGSLTAMQALIDRGVKIITHGIDQLLFYAMCKEILAPLRDGLRATSSGRGAGHS
jgi:2-keto-3-deoxy-L-rhamnonate aldolase RhmA